MSNRSSTFVWKLASYWNWKRFCTAVGTMFGSAVLTFIIVGITAEFDIARMFPVLTGENPTAVTGYTVSTEDRYYDDGYNPKVFERYFPEYTREGRRGFTFDVNANGFWSWIEKIEYKVSLYNDEKWISVTKYTGDTFKIAAVIWLLGSLFELITWFFGMPGTFVSVRRRLRPLTDLTDAPPQVAPAPTVTEAKPALRVADNSEQKERLGAISEVIARINAGSLDMRIDISKCHPDLKSLAEAINSMLERIDEAYRLQSRFVSDASHELRTPIAVIQGYASLMDRWGKADPEALQESISAVRSEAEAMKQLVEQLLFLARGDNASIHYKPEAVDAKALTEEVFRESQMIDDKHVWELQTADVSMVYADQTLLKQALRILVDNATKYTPAGEAIFLKLSQDNTHVKLTVQDEGIGMSPEVLPYIFDRFYRADSSRDRKTGGTGLGLSIAKWIVDKHGGYFDILSREGIGTRMTICLKKENNNQ